MKEIKITWRTNITDPSAKMFTFFIFVGMVMLIGIFSIQSIKGFPIISTHSPSPMTKILENKKIAMIIAFKDFRDEEYFIPKEIFKGKGAAVKTVSTQMGTAVGSQGGEVEVDITLDELDVINFDAIVFIGGAGAPKELDNEKSYGIAKETFLKNKILAAICISPTILAKSGVLTDKRATVWSSPLDKGAIQILEANNAIYDDRSVVVDGNIVTADGPKSAERFAEMISNLLERQED